jgi:hypothetical protein
MDRREQKAPDIGKKVWSMDGDTPPIPHSPLSAGGGHFFESKGSFHAKELLPLNLN